MGAYFRCRAHLEEPDVAGISKDGTEQDQIDQGKPCGGRNRFPTDGIRFTAQERTDPEHAAGKKHLPRRTGKIVHFLFGRRFVFCIQCSESPGDAAYDQENHAIFVMDVFPAVEELFQEQKPHPQESRDNAYGNGRKLEICFPHGDVQSHDPDDG